MWWHRGIRISVLCEGVCTEYGVPRMRAKCVFDMFVMVVVITKAY